MSHRLRLFVRLRQGELRDVRTAELTLLRRPAVTARFPLGTDNVLSLVPRTKERVLHRRLLTFVKSLPSLFQIAYMHVCTHRKWS